MKIRIGIDLRCMAGGKKSGVEEYARKSAESLIKKNPDKKIIVFINSYKKKQLDLAWAEKFKNVEIKKYNYPNKFLNFSIWFLGWPKLDKLTGGLDIFFMPNIGFASLSKECKLILTVHDLSFERFPHFFSLKRRFWHYLINTRKLCQKANQIWAVSRSTGEDLVSLYRIAPEKIKVVHPPFEAKRFQAKVSQSKIARVKNKYQLPDQYILFLGTIEPRKNVISVLKAFEKLNRIAKYKGLALVVAGPRGWLWQGTISCFISSRAKQNMVFTDFIEEEDKRAVYSLAKIFVYPSFLEGFGFPPPEAISAGVPTIVSNCSSLPEIVQDSVLLVDPYRPNEIFQAFRAFLDSEKLCYFYVRKGKNLIGKTLGAELSM